MASYQADLASATAAPAAVALPVAGRGNHDDPVHAPTQMQVSAP